MVSRAGLSEARLGNLDRDLYREFLKENSHFFALTKQRVISYWDCYYRTTDKEEYVGFVILNLFEELVR